MQLPYTIMDVFTNKRLKGNPLAVVFDADHVSDEKMMAITKEFNLSETVFVCSPKNERHVASLRIFTPAQELPFAGHPTVGTAVLLGLRQRISAIRLEEKVGTIVSITEPISKVSGHARFSLPQLPKKVGDAPSNEDVAKSLGLSADQIGYGEVSPAIYSAGVPFVVVPLRDEEALAAIKLERRGWSGIYSGASDKVYAFTPTPERKTVAFAARSFVNMGELREDPATGSAAAALCGLLASDYYEGEGQVDFMIEQGAHIDRHSYIEAQIKLENGALTHAGIGGQAIIVAEGQIFIDED